MVRAPVQGLCSPHPSTILDFECLDITPDDDTCNPYDGFGPLGPNLNLAQVGSEVLQNNGGQDLEYIIDSADKLETYAGFRSSSNFDGV